ncbi:hypothetical protein NC797_02900 [Aquibacillus sp. 3ASR75-11]|uniref:Uncharacterized protein n=1 Tax=Terrihalobacillus insolitus TaxID=2950438 RepID=A0A9X3WUB4_9BACI|nr:hypothetical protein [Terrihalobacillus insolitus]MDC3411867.1 hypothetical protein [Terrihalobacillus insolitus]MDC3423454.1 hypothetical protein [Terrihalobacillus insolitus]
MKNRFKITLIGIIGLIVIVTTLTIFFLLGIQKTTITWWALSFILISEIALFIGLEIINSFKKNIFISSGISVTLIINLLIITAICFFSSAFNRLNSFIITEIIILAISTIIVLSFLLFSGRIDSNEQKTVYDQKFMYQCEKRIYNIYRETKGKEYSDELFSLYESFKYMDKVGNSNVDQKIAKLMDQLEGSVISFDSETKDILNEIDVILARRKNEIAVLKRGAY